MLALQVYFGLQLVRSILPNDREKTSDTQGRNFHTTKEEACQNRRIAQR